MKNIGKIVGQHIYVHTIYVGSLPIELQGVVHVATQITGLILGAEANVVKIARDGSTVSLLQYQAFFDDAFPALQKSWFVDIEAKTAKFRTFEQSLNPPILHRKELLLPPDHPARPSFVDLTQTAELAGLFDDPMHIGFKRSFETLASQKGYRIVGNTIVAIGNDESPSIASGTRDRLEGIARHLTALTRHGFSAPVQTLARFGFLDKSRSVFDYGCGRGDDVRGLNANGIVVAGWDPYYSPHNPKINSSIVNLGFVINVIENVRERIDALRNAYALATELLVVAAMTTNQDADRGTPYGDGILTSRNTFQKYFTQVELKSFIAENLENDPIAVGPGIFYVFKDKDVEQKFLYTRLQNRRNLNRLTHLSRPVGRDKLNRADSKYEEYRDSLESLWDQCISLGRIPDRFECENLNQLCQGFGSLSAAFRFIQSRKQDANSILEEARATRVDDLRVYFAQMQFEKRKPYKHLENQLKIDVKEFFGDYVAAVCSGRELLFAISSVDEIAKACTNAAEQGVGWLEEGASLQLHTSMVERLPSILRAYVGCGTVLYGDVSSADVVKIHISSGKLTLTKFDDFLGKPVPRMLQRVKINLRKQTFDVFEYGDLYETSYLYRKSRFINEEFSNYAEQLRFEEELNKLNIFDFGGYGPQSSEFDSLLSAMRYEIDGFQLVRSRAIPDRDSRCGRYLTYRDLIECGETQAATGIENLPSDPDSYSALLDLALNVLDPIIEYFGAIRLTYGFCSPQLSAKIGSRTAPKLDQHASHERNRFDTYICDRLGAACDFIVDDENMRTVSDWIIANVPFDRLYFYGEGRPIHVSYVTPRAGLVIDMVKGPSGRLVPRKRHASAPADLGKA
jgi:DNA phosphorothioation-associated putative methyltransferase